jgi:hypothetical protein
MKKLSLLALCCLLILCGRSCADSNATTNIDRQLISDLNKFYLDQMDSHQLLFLGESKHNDQVMNNAIIGFLNYWLDGIEKNDSISKKITLILEYSASFGKQLEEFFRSGDVTPFGMEIQGRTLNTLEFFYDLKNVSQRAGKIKKHRDLELTILCPEQDIPFNTPREEQARIAATERDSNITRTILDYVKQNPDRKLVAFYGGGHMANKEHPDYPTTPWGLQLKDLGVSTYTIGLNHFGDAVPFPLPFSKIDTDFVVTQQSLEETFGGGELGTNAAAFYREPYFQAITLKDIPSVLVIRKAAEYARQSSRYIPVLVSLWHRYTGEDISNIGDIVGHFEQNIGTVNTDKVIDSLKLFDNLFKEFTSKNTSRPEIDKTMFGITCFGNVLNRKPYHLTPDQTAEQLWGGIVDKYQKEIKVQLYTSLLFYGTEAERTTAQARLRELSQKDLKSPKEWLEYSRQLWNSI